MLFGEVNRRQPFPPYPVQSWMLPQNQLTDQIQMIMPPDQRYTGEAHKFLQVPSIQKTFGPAPNDAQLSVTRPGYIPYHKGWIDTGGGNAIYTLQGGFGADEAAVTDNDLRKLQAELLAKENRSRNWAIFASVVSGLALATTATIAILEFKRGRRRGRR